MAVIGSVDVPSFNLIFNVAGSTYVRPNKISRQTPVLESFCVKYIVSLWILYLNHASHQSLREAALERFNFFICTHDAYSKIGLTLTLLKETFLNQETENIL